jgi:hypothetical protein
MVLCLLLVCSLNGMPVNQHASPRQTLQTFCDAVEHHDVAAVLQCFTKLDEKKTILLQAEMKGAVEHYRLRQDLKRFGDAASGMTTPSLVEEIRDRLMHSAIQVNENTAVFDAAYEPEVIAIHPEGSILRLQKADGQWLIDGGNLFATEIEEANISHNLKKVKLLTEILREIANDVESGKLSTAKEAKKALFQKLISGPSTQP